jgi:hypothetical protein
MPDTDRDNHHHETETDQPAQQEPTEGVDEMVDTLTFACPPYDETQSALLVLNDAFFYHGKSNVADLYVEERTRHLGNKTIGEIVTEFIMLEPKWGKLASRIGCNVESLQEFFEQQPDPDAATKALNKKRVYIAADHGIEDEMKRFEWFVSYEGLFAEDLYSDNDHPPPGDITFVMGSSGSGKTLFSLGAVATRDDKNTVNKRKILGMSVTVYLNLSRFSQFVSEMDGKKRLRYLREKLSQFAGVPIKEQLDMHVSLVLDEAGSASVRGHFERKQNVLDFYKEMTELGTSFWLVVCGTGVFGTELASGSDCRKIRMKQWSQVEFLIIARAKWAWVTDQPKFADETVEAIYRHSVLSALATNARCANFLIRAITERIYKINFARKNWQNFLWECTGELVNEVVGHYVRNHGLKNLKSEQRRRIAAWVLFVVEESRKLGRGPEVLAPLQILPEQMDPEPVIQKYWMPVVWGLMDVNILYSGDDGHVRATFDRPDENSVVLSPALVIVLFALLGGQAAIVTGWEG